MKKTLFILLTTIALIGCKKEIEPTPVVEPLPMISFVTAYISQADSTYTVGVDLVTNSGNIIVGDIIEYTPPYSQFSYSQQFGANMSMVILNINSTDSMLIKHIVSNNKDMTHIGIGSETITFDLN